MTNKLIAMALAASAMFGARAETSGSCMNRAIPIGLGGSTEVTLVNEYDPDFREYLGRGCRYYKVTLTKGSAYTIWISGGQTSSMVMSVDADWNDDNAPYASVKTAPCRSHISVLTTGTRMIRCLQLITSTLVARLETRVRFLRRLAFVPLVNLARKILPFG